jgi:hypothetical protein
MKPHTHTLYLTDNNKILPALPAESVDTIMTDPPYNTRQSREYPDTFEPQAWRAMMDAFLRQAHRLLRPSGVLFLAVGQTMLADALSLGDAVFGPKIALLTWTDPRGHAGNRFTRAGVDYIAAWAKNPSLAQPWTEPLPGIDEFMTTVAEAFAATGSDEDAARAGRTWARAHPEYPWAANYPRSVHGTPARHAPLTARGNPYRYTVTRPDGTRVCPPDGWRCPKTTFDRLAENGLIIWSGACPKRLLPLDPGKGRPPSPIIERDRRQATDHLARLIGRGRFAAPKDHRELARWIAMSTPIGGVVLDPFAGSASTGEAVMRLNAERGFHLSSIAVEKNVTDVARDRLQTVAAQTGERLDITTSPAKCAPAA